MNPLVLFLPVYRASTTAFLAGLGVLALLDFARIEFGLLGGLSWIGMLAIWFFTLSLHINRRRHAERGGGLAFLPLVLAVIVKGIAAFFAMVASLYPAMLRFAEDNGVDTDDPVALNEALSEPGFQQEFSRQLQENPEMVAQMLESSGISSFIGFWLVIAIFAIWFARMVRTGG